MDTPVSDCVDSLAAVKPTAAETGIDSGDNDCDGSQLIRREYLTSFELAPDWTLTNSSVGSGSLSIGSNGKARLTTPGPFTSGKYTAEVSVTAKSGTCTLTVISGTTSAQNLSVGTLALTFANVLPGATPTKVEFACAAGASATIDWASFQNGAYAIPPLNDVVTTSDTMGVQGTGGFDFARASDDGRYLMIGADVGGFAWQDLTVASDDWTTANGTASEMPTYASHGATDAWADSGARMFLLTGNFVKHDDDFDPPDHIDDGALYSSDNKGLNWTQRSANLGSTALAHSRYVDDCDSPAAKRGSSGHLLIHDPADAANSLYVASGLDGNRGLFRFEMAGSICPAYDEDSLPADSVIGAMDMLLDESGAWLIVGYRSVEIDKSAVTSGSQSGLYICPSFADLGRTCATSSPKPECKPVMPLDGDVGYDVLDMAVDPSDPGRMFVVDGGWDHVDDSASSERTCSTSEPTVYGLALTPELDEDGYPRVDVWDTDSTDELAWWEEDDGTESELIDCSAEPYAALDPAGDLQGQDCYNAGDANYPTSVAIDPLGEWMTVSYAVSSGNLAFAAPRMYRVRMEDVRLDRTLPWEPMQFWDATSSTTVEASRVTRRAAVHVGGNFLQDEPFTELLAPDWPMDSVFVEHAVSNASDVYESLFIGGLSMWWLDESHYGYFGYDADYSDLDDLDYTNAMRIDQPDQGVQDGSMRNVSVCPDCNQNADVIWMSAADFGAVSAPEVSSTGVRSRADRPCPLHKTGSTVMSVDNWTVPGTSGYQTWMVLDNQAQAGDPSNLRKIAFDDGSGNGFCFDGVSTEGSGFQLAVSGTWSQLCADKSTVATDEHWPACQDGSADASSLTFDDVGQPVQIIGLDDNLAILLARAADHDTDPGDAVYDQYGQGLWLVAGNATDGLQYLPIAIDDVLTPTSSVLSTDLFMDGTSDRQTHISVDPLSTTSGSVTTWRVFLTSPGQSGANIDAALTEIAIAWDSATQTVTSPVDAYTLDTDDPLDLWSNSNRTGPPYVDGTPLECHLDASQLVGTSVSPEGRWLMLYGGAEDPGADPYLGTLDGGGICAIDLASFGGSGYPSRIVATTDEMPFKITQVRPHPHVEGVWFVSGRAPDNCNNCGPAGLMELQRRRKSDGSFAWASRHIEGDDLEVRNANDVDVGGVGPGGVMNHVYLATGGGGPWDMALAW